MSQLRLNPLTGRWVAVAAGRQNRPGDLVSRQLPVESDPDRPCPFCPGNEEATPPALETYGKHGDWVVRVVPNRYPAFDGDEPLRVDRCSSRRSEGALHSGVAPPRSASASARSVDIARASG